jgi:hypothetical protein
MAAGPCTAWITAAELTARPDISTEVIDSGVLAAAATDASQLLFALSGRQYSGACSATIRPYAGSGGGFGGGVSGLPVELARGALPDSWMLSVNGGVCWSGITLGVYPIRSVTTVKIDGVTVSSTQYRVDDQRWLVRKNGRPWPAWQRTDLDDTQVGTFSVTVSYGADPPAAGISAASALGAELAKSRAGLTHRLPQRLTSVTRQGVSITLSDWSKLLADGYTGLFEVDLFLRSANPGRQSRRPSVWSPDIAQHRRS